MARYRLRFLGSELPLRDAGTIVIGRDPDCDIPLGDAATSRRHARLSVTPNGVWIEDLASHNGVVINGQPGPSHARLVPGDTFTVGRTAFSLEFAEDRKTLIPPAVTPPRAPADARTEALTIDPGLASYSEARAALTEEARPLPERFATAVGMVQRLADGGSPAFARALLGDALDVLVATHARGVLPPLLVIKVRRLVSQLAAHLGEDPTWRLRLEALGRAEG